jgi:uncharacterized membrane protein
MWVLPLLTLLLGWSIGETFWAGAGLAGLTVGLVVWYQAAAAGREAASAVREAREVRELALRRISELTARMARLEAQGVTPPAVPEPASALPEAQVAAEPAAVELPPEPAPVVAATHANEPTHAHQPAHAHPMYSAPAASAEEPELAAQPPAPALAAREVADLETPEQRLRRWLLGDNPVARVGVLVLLIGVVLVLRLAAEHHLFPLEARLACVALGGAGLVVFGYRERQERVTFARLLQGAGIAAMYLVVFFAYRTFDLLPSSLTFGLLVSLVFASGVLAIAQDALALLFVGTLGGFAAPILASSGSGNHVALFSYYLVLNALVLAVAWFKDWRLLTLTGFVATFGIATYWGVLRYTPELFASTEPFLIAFYAIYVAINIVTALRRPATLRGGLSSSLTFGLPLVTITLQTALAGERNWLVALTALVMAVLYYVLARLLRTRDAQALRTLVDGYAALAIGLATLSVPFALDSRAMVSATWVLEAAGLFWVGVRSRRLLLRLASIALLAAGVIAAAADGVWSRLDATSLPVLNPSSLCALLVLAAALFIATQARRADDALHGLERGALQLLVLPAVALAALALWLEVDASTAAAAGRAHVWLALASLWAGALAAFGARVRLPVARWTALTSLLAAALLLLDDRLEGQLLWTELGALCWPAAVLGNGLALHLQGTHREPPVRLAHVLFPVWGAALVSCAGWDVVSSTLALARGWADAALAVGFVVLLLATDRVRRLPREPFVTFAPEYAAVSRVFEAALLAYWLVALTRDGSALPLPFVPVLNPLELVLCGVMLLFVQRARSELAALGDDERRDWLPGLPIALVLLAFLGLNSVLARAVHHLAGVDYALHALWRSDPFQVGLSVLWASLGLIGAFWASRRAQREVWFAASALLFVVVAKLFVIDLARVGQLPRILSFLAVGALLLAVGYLAPLPPARAVLREGDKP